MVYTLTLNPSIDYVVRLDQFITGNTNRTSSEEYYIGGKGINVSCILRELGMSSTALGSLPFIARQHSGKACSMASNHWGQ